MTTCEECGKYDKNKKTVGMHWICKDCKIGGGASSNQKSESPDDRHHS